MSITITFHPDVELVGAMDAFLRVNGIDPSALDSVARDRAIGHLLEEYVIAVGTNRLVSEAGRAAEAAATTSTEASVKTLVDLADARRQARRG